MELENLKNVLFDQAKYFLSKAGEFYPFGSFISKDGKIVPVGVQLENDHPETEEVISFLEKAIITKLKNGESKIAGIGTDVFYKPAGENAKKSAIQVRMLHSSGESVDFYIPYEYTNERFIFEEPFSERGTLNFLK